MSYSRSTLTVLILVACCPISSRAADETKLLPRSGVLVLQNERVLRGKILRVGDRYVVGLNEHDEVSVPIDKVAMHCDTLEEAYQQKREELPSAPKVADHLRLGDWCLRYDLTGAAAEQLMCAQRLVPDDPANTRFETRLRMAVSGGGSQPMNRVAPSQIASSEELEEMVKQLPLGSVELFTNTIQPLLINRCGGGSCHASNSQSDFRLVYPHGNQTLTRRFTQQNLKMALEMLDENEPAKSPLLMMATRAHGRAPKPALADEDVTQLQHLADWVFKSLNRKDRSPPAIVKAPDALLLQPVDQRTGTRPVELPPNSTSKAPDRQTPGGIRDNHVVPAGHQELVPQSQDPQRVQGNDPFDPEIFNRRYLKKQSTPKYWR